MRMGDRTSMLQGMNDVADDLIDSRTVPDLREYKRPKAAHLAGVTLHDAEVSPNRLGQIGLVYDQQIGLSDAGTSFTRNLVAAGYVNDINSVICQFAAEVGGQIVAPGFQ